MRDNSTCVLFNPRAGSADDGINAEDSGPKPPAQLDDANPPLSSSDVPEGWNDRLGEWKDRLGRWVAIPAPGEGGRLAERLIDEGIERIIIAGGDGTVRDVAEGVLRSGRPVPLGILPLGTGNDFARTLGLPLDVAHAGEVIERAERIRELDAISVTFEDGRLFGVNVASGGFGGEVGHARVADPHVVPGFLSYLAGAASVLPELRDRSRLRFTWEDGSDEEIETLAVVVANGRTAAGGVQVAPHADPEDGMLDVLAVTDAAVAELTRVGIGLLAGDYTTAQSVLERKVRSVRIFAHPPTPFSLDGERVPEAGARLFEVMPRALSWIVGPDYAPSGHS